MLEMQNLNRIMGMGFVTSISTTYQLYCLMTTGGNDEPNIVFMRKS
jgi:hypothetical protein